MLLPMFLLSRLKVLSILCFPNHMSCVTLYPRHYWASIKIPLAFPRLWIVPMKAEECCMAQIPLLSQQGKWAPCALCPVPGSYPPAPSPWPLPTSGLHHPGVTSLKHTHLPAGPRLPLWVSCPGCMLNCCFQLLHSMT